MMVYVSPPVSMLLVPLMIPLLHFHLLTHKRRTPSWMLSALAILANIAASTMLPCDDISIDLMIKGLFCFYFGVRYLELAVLDRPMTSRWSLREYREFMLTSDNESLRAGNRQKGKLAKRKIVPIPVSARTTSFYAAFAGKFLVMYAGFAVTKAYLVKYGYDYKGIHLVDLTDIRAVLDHLYVALNSYCGIFLAYNMVWFSLDIAFSAPYIAVFANPLAATSLHDFWSHRWNKPISNALHRSVFTPVVNWTPHKRVSTLATMTATVVTFIASGLIHEIIFWTMQANDSPGTQVIFFAGQGILSVFQYACSQRLLQTHLGKRLFGGTLGSVLGWTFTMGSIFVMLPLHAGPMGRSGSALHIPVPGMFVDTVQAYI